MAWTYSGNPAASTMDEVRFLCGDTDTDRQLLQNDEITYCSAEEPNTTLAAALACDAIASKLSQDVTSRIDDVSYNASDLAKAFAAKAKDLRKRAVTGVLPFAGGRTISGKEALASDTDAVQPAFFVGMDDNPGAGGRSPWTDED